jgi:hypothetical protein
MVAMLNCRTPSLSPTANHLHGNQGVYTTYSPNIVERLSGKSYARANLLAMSLVIAT